MLFEHCEDRRVLAQVQWILDSDGSWDVPENWSTGSVPGPGDDVVIDRGTANPVITVHIGDQSVRSLQSTEALTLSGGVLTVDQTIQVNNTLTLAGGTLKDATVVGGTELMLTTAGGTLDGVTVNGDLDLSQVSGVNVSITNNLVLNGTMYIGHANGSTYGTVYFGEYSAASESLSGAATVVFGGSSSNTLYNYIGTGGTLTLAPTVTLRGKSGALVDYWGSGTIINQGTIAADDSGGQTTFSTDANFSYGDTSATPAAIDTTGVVNAAPPGVYQTQRTYYDFSYYLPNLTVGADYTVRLHFAEIEYSAAGQRKFNVDINGAGVLTDFDIFAAAGGKNKAIVEEFTATREAIADLAPREPIEATETPEICGRDAVPVAVTKRRSASSA